MHFFSENKIQFTRKVTLLNDWSFEGKSEREKNIATTKLLLVCHLTPNNTYAASCTQPVIIYNGIMLRN